MIDGLRKLCNHPQLVHDNSLFDFNRGSHDASSGGQQITIVPPPPTTLMDKDMFVLETGTDKENSSASSCNSNVTVPASQLATKTSQEVLLAQSGKMMVLDGLLSNMKSFHPSDCMVIVSGWTTTLDIIQSMCAAKGLVTSRLDGKVMASKRQQIVDSFNNQHTRIDVLLLSAKAGGCGLNLIG